MKLTIDIFLDKAFDLCPPVSRVSFADQYFAMGRLSEAAQDWHDRGIEWRIHQEFTRLSEER
jgi:hypothetical protein